MISIRPRRRLIALSVLILLPVLWSAALAERETSYVYPPFKHTLGMNRVGEMELKLFLGPLAKIANPQGIAVVKLAIRDDPKTDRDDDEITLVGVNSGQGEIVYNPSLYAVKSFGRVGSGDGEFKDPRGIDIDREGNVVLADTGNRRLVLLHLNENELSWRLNIDQADGPFSPTDVVISEGVIWCSDHAGGRILRFGMDGTFLGVWPAEAVLDGPLALDVIGAREQWNRSRRFSLLTVDQSGQRARVYDQDGSLRAERGLGELIPSPGRFGYPVIDLHGQVLLPDSVQGRIVKLDRDLNLLTVLDHIDDDDRTLDHPNSLALYRRFGQLFIAESKGGTYAWTGTDLKELRLSSIPGMGLKLEYHLTEPSLVTLILTKDGQETVVQKEKRRQAGQVAELIELEGGKTSGDWLLVQAKPTYSARKKLTVERRLAVPGSLPGASGSAGSRSSKPSDSGDAKGDRP